MTCWPSTGRTSSWSRETPPAPSPLGWAAFYHQIPLVHLEAGLRTRNIYSPFPEEANRRLDLAALGVAPGSDRDLRANLEAEGVAPSSITVTGNTVIDSLPIRTVDVPVRFVDPAVAAAVASGQPILLVTTHRRESWGDRMAEAMLALRDVAIKHPELCVLLPMHRNPVVRDVVEANLLDQPNVLLTEPLSYHVSPTCCGPAVSSSRTPVAYRRRRPASASRSW